MFEIKLIFYGLSSMLQFSEFEWALSYSIWDVFNNFLLLDATDRSKINSDQKRFFIALSLYPLSFFANTPFKSSLFCLMLEKFAIVKTGISSCLYMLCSCNLCLSICFSDHNLGTFGPICLKFRLGNSEEPRECSLLCFEIHNWVGRL